MRSASASLSLDVTVRYEGFSLAVDTVIALEGVTALFGPSGSGKSTLLRVIAGLERAASGRIAFGTETWQDDGTRTYVPANRRGVGYVFQDARLFGHLSVAGNLRYADRRSQNERGRIAFDEVVEALDLEPLLKRRAGSLSGGERQRVAIGRSILTRPRLLLMDEPLAALDIERKAEILPYIERLPITFGVPIVYVTHAVEEVARLARTMIAVSNGAIVAAGPVVEMLERLDLQPLTGRFEAGVVLPARVVGHDPKFCLTRLNVAGQTLVMPALDVAVGGEVPLRVRARDVALSLARPDGISVQNILAATIIELLEEPESAFAELLLDIGGPHLRARITRQAVAELALAEGSAVYALIKSISFDRRALAQ